MNLEDLKKYVQSAAALRYRARLQPAGGPGDKVFPPTYEGGKYAEEKRRIDGETVDCVHLDSVQSQANRMEEALQEAAQAGTITLPRVEVDFRAKAEQLLEGAKSEEERASLEDLKKVGVISSLDAPHRLADAILRDSRDAEGHHFRQTPEGKVLDSASIKNATGLFGIAPTSLLFGIWDSAGPRGGLGVKFQRAIVSELVGVGATVGEKSSSRIDPLGIVLNAGPLFSDGKTEDWTLEKVGKKIGKEGKPSEANHGNVTPTVTEVNGGVTFDYALQTTVISLPALRRLQFPVDNKQSKDIDLIAQTVLAALGLAAATLTISKGISLRSRCDLVPEPDAARWELVKGDGNTESFQITSDEACELLKSAVEAAKKAGLLWREEPLVLLPSDSLAELVRHSRQLTSQTKSEG